MGKKSKRKGDEGEREWANFLSDRGFPARRKCQFSGAPHVKRFGEESPDVVVDKDCQLSQYHQEVKRYARVAVDKWMAQAYRDKQPDQIPIVAYRADHGSWRVVMSAHDWVIRENAVRFLQDTLDVCHEEIDKLEEELRAIKKQ